MAEMFVRVRTKLCLLILREFIHSVRMEIISLSQEKLSVIQSMPAGWKKWLKFASFAQCYKIETHPNLRTRHLILNINLQTLGTKYGNLNIQQTRNKSSFIS